MTRSRRNHKIRFESTRLAANLLIYGMIIFLVVLLFRVGYNIVTPVYIGVNDAIVSGAARNGFGSPDNTTKKSAGSSTPSVYKPLIQVGTPKTSLVNNNGVTEMETETIDEADDVVEPAVEETTETITPETNIAPMAEITEEYITEWTDLKGAKSKVSEADIMSVIDRFAGPSSALREDGVAKAYITASKKTGYDPIFLLALTACEAGWDVSDDHSSRSNPYSIGMWDDSFDHGSTIGNTFAEGIINGAEINYGSWYCDRSCHSLHEMQNYYDEQGNHLFYASNGEWEYMVSDVMNMIYSYIDDGGEV